MSDEHTVEFLIDLTTGDVSFVVKGIKGGGCSDIAKAFAKETGLNVNRDSATSEYREENRAHCGVKQST